MFVQAALYDDVAEGGAIAVKVEGQEIALCKVGGEIFAVSRRCGHQNAPLNSGTLFGHIITCPLHFAQFDIRTGHALFGEGNRDYGRKRAKSDGPSPAVARFESGLFREVVTKDLRTYPVRVEDGRIMVDPACHETAPIEPR